MDRICAGRFKRLSLATAYITAVGAAFTAMLGTGLALFIGQ